MRLALLLIPLLISTCAAPSQRSPERADSALTKSATESPAEPAPARTAEVSPAEPAARSEPVDLQIARENLAATLVALGDLAAARTLYESVLETAARTLPEGHPSLLRARRNLVSVLWLEIANARNTSAPRLDENASPSASVRVIADLVRANVRSATSMARAAILQSSAREAEERCSLASSELDHSLSFASELGTSEQTNALDAESFALSETTRAAAIQVAALARAAATSPQVATARSELRRSAAQLAALAQQRSSQDDFNRALRDRDSAERKLAELAVTSSASQGAGLAIDTNSIAASLGSDSAAVVFRRYRRSKIECPQGTTLALQSSAEVMCAFVVRNTLPDAEGKVTVSLRRIELGPMDAIEEAVRAWRDAVGVGEGARDDTDPVSAPLPSDGNAQGAALRARVFDPLRVELALAKRLIVVPDDVLHLVPLDALPVDDALRIGDRWPYELHNTLTELVRPDHELEGSGPLVVFGDVDFGPITVAADASESTQSAERVRGSAHPRRFVALPASGDEVRGIVHQFREQYGAEAAVERCVGGEATRERLVALAPTARYLHIATHGWFVPDSIRSWTDPDRSGARMSGVEQVRGMSPLLLCGLALAGANSQADGNGRVIGSITGEEIATLDLTNCDLAVLAGGDTNVGERRAGQGVASLQKALQMAGARSVITSLWKVPDEATKELMLDFYRRLWVEKKPKWQALWEAKTKLRNAKDERGMPKYTTRDWAAWVLTGAPE